jgi:hypothetical protein
MLRAITSKRFSFLACTQQAATISKSLAHPLSALGRWQTTQHKHEYNAHCNSDSDGLINTTANPAQTIEIPDNPSPLNFLRCFPTYCESLDSRCVLRDNLTMQLRVNS